MQTEEQRVLDMIFGRARPNSLYRALELGLVPPEFEKEAIAIVSGYPYPRQPSRALSARSLYNDPSWDNIVRALEEDR